MDQDQTEDQITRTERIPAPLRLGANNSAKKNRRDGIPIAAQSKVACKRRITNPLKKRVARSPLLGLNQRRVTPVRASTSARRKLIVEKDKEIPCDKGGIINRASNNNLRVACLVSYLFGLGFTNVSVPTVLLQKSSGSSCRDLRACLCSSLQLLTDVSPMTSLLSWERMSKDCTWMASEGDQRSQISDVLSQHDMTVMDYPSHYQNCPLLPLEMIHHF
ncbi:hypothetical protein YC2023_120484 [Brassica napus]